MSASFKVGIKKKLDGEGAEGGGGKAKERGSQRARTK